MKQGFFRTAHPNSCLKRLENQYGIISPDHDFNSDADDSESVVAFNGGWPRSMGDGCTTPMEQCQETGDYLFNLQLTQVQIDSLPKSDNPNFTMQIEGEVDTQGDPLPLPTYMVEGDTPGVFSPRTICIQA